jgi:signal peptidase I
MHFDFPTFLVLATLITGLIWGGHALMNRGKQPAAEGAAVEEPLLVEYSRSFFPIILLVLVIRSFIAEPFRIPSGSMMPTLLDGDFILVNKFSYGLRLPVLNTKVLDLGSPKTGDVVVFRYPVNPQINYIKRVVGMPGDRVEYRNKVLYINGHEVPQQLSGAYVGEGSGASSTGDSLRLENLGGVNHNILVKTHKERDDFEYIVGEGEYFVMGDNRDNSQDSRYWGTVPDRNLVGKSFMIWMNWDWDASSAISWKRIGTMVH